MADRTRLKQMLINLLSNAIKYNREQGTVVVECAATSAERIRISVKDTGRGIACRKSWRSCSSRSIVSGRKASAEEGTGIGLVVSKRLVELMGGVIGVESTVGVGSVFWFELLLTTAPALAGENAEYPKRRRRRKWQAGAPRRTLLYVEDNPANMTLVEKLIARRPDIRLLSAVNGTLGIELARAHPCQT